MKQAHLKSDPKHNRKVLICGYTEEEDCLCVVTEAVESEYDLDDEVVDCEEEEVHQTQLQIQQIDPVVADVVVDCDQIASRAAWFEARRQSRANPTSEHHQNKLQAQHDDDPTGHEDEDPIAPEVGDCKDFQAQIEASNPPIRQVCDQLIHDKVSFLAESDFSSPNLADNSTVVALCTNTKGCPVADKVFDKKLEPGTTNHQNEIEGDGVTIEGEFDPGGKMMSCFTYMKKNDDMNRPSGSGVSYGSSNQLVLVIFGHISTTIIGSTFPLLTNLLLAVIYSIVANQSRATRGSSTEIASVFVSHGAHDIMGVQKSSTDEVKPQKYRTTCIHGLRYEFGECHIPSAEFNDRYVPDWVLEEFIKILWLDLHVLLNIFQIGYNHQKGSVISNGVFLRAVFEPGGMELQVWVSVYPNAWTISNRFHMKCIELIFEIAENKGDYTKFYEVVTKNFKLSIHEDSQNKTKIAELFRYHSTKSGDEVISLKDYVTRMKERRSDIYYITREIINSHLEVNVGFKRKMKYEEAYSQTGEISLLSQIQQKGKDLKVPLISSYHLFTLISSGIFFGALGLRLYDRIVKRRANSCKSKLKVNNLLWGERERTEVIILRGLIDDKFNKMCGQCNHRFKGTTIVDMTLQIVYWLKEWSFGLYNCGNYKKRVLTFEVVEFAWGTYVHEFKWLNAHKIGSVMFVYKILVHYNKVVLEDKKALRIEVQHMIIKRPQRHLYSVVQRIIEESVVWAAIMYRVMMANYGDAHKPNDATYCLVLHSCTNLNTLQLGEGAKSQGSHESYWIFYTIETIQVAYLNFMDCAYNEPQQLEPNANFLNPATSLSKQRPGIALVIDLLNNTSEVLCSSDHMGYILKGSQLSDTKVVALNVAFINGLGFTNDYTSRRNEVPTCNHALFATGYGLENGDPNRQIKTTWEADLGLGFGLDSMFKLQIGMKLCVKYLSKIVHFQVALQGNQRTHSHVIAFRAVTSQDGMTADWCNFEHKFFDDEIRQICNSTVRDVNQVVQDIALPDGDRNHALAKNFGCVQLGGTYAILGQFVKLINCYPAVQKIQNQVLGEKEFRFCETCKGDYEDALEHYELASMSMAVNGQEADVASTECNIGGFSPWWSHFILGVQFPIELKSLNSTVYVKESSTRPTSVNSALSWILSLPLNCIGNIVQNEMPPGYTSQKLQKQVHFVGGVLLKSEFIDISDSVVWCLNKVTEGRAIKGIVEAILSVMVFFVNISLVLIDEIHPVNDFCGGALRTIANRIKMLLLNLGTKLSTLVLALVEEPRLCLFARITLGIGLLISSVLFVFKFELGTISPRIIK